MTERVQAREAWERKRSGEAGSRIGSTEAGEAYRKAEARGRPRMDGQRYMRDEGKRVAERGGRELGMDVKVEGRFRDELDGEEKVCI